MKPFIDVIPVISTLETEFYREYWRRCEVPLLPGARAGYCEDSRVGQLYQSRLLLLLQLLMLLVIFFLEKFHNILYRLVDHPITFVITWIEVL